MSKKSMSIREKLKLMEEIHNLNQKRWDEFSASERISNQSAKTDEKGTNPTNKKSGT